MQNRTRTNIGIAVFMLYAVLISVAIFHHEPWFDEAQAWLLGRDSSPGELFSTYLRYEGSPGLWHLLLSLAAKSGLPYASLNMISGSIALCGVFIFVRYAPFPLPIKILLPFSYFMFFQYAVVARSYVLLPSLMFLLAIVYPERRQRIVSYVFLLALLANASMHGLVIACSLAALDLLELWRLRGTFDQAMLRRTLISYGILLLLGFSVVWQLWMPNDHSFVQPKKTYKFSTVIDISQKFLNNALTENRNLSNIVFLISCWHFWKTKTLRFFLLPVLALGHLYALAYANVWHEGVLFLLWIFCLWISLSPQDTAAMPRHSQFAMLALGLVLVIHISWSVVAFRNDFNKPYSAAKAVAAFLKSKNTEAHSIYATSFHSIAILPYFPKNIFANYGSNHRFAFWDWSLKNDMIQDLDLILEASPDIIVYGIKTGFVDKSPSIPGYTSVKFAGQIYWKNRSLEEDSYMVYEKIAAQANSRGGQ